MRILILSIFCLYIATSKTWALVPIESLVLGNFAENYNENESDPLNYVFSREKLQSSSSSLKFKHELALYRGFYEEGKNISNYCKVNHPIHYSNEWEKIQVMRSVLSEIQYIGLDISSRALPQYAKALSFTKEEYSNFVEGIVGNYCSANLSVISLKELKNNLLVKFDKDNNFKLPTINGNPYFPDNMDSYLLPKNAIEQEFKFSVKLFKSICSWGGDPTNPGGLIPILKNPALMAFFIRQMDNQNIDWKESINSVFLKHDSNTVQVTCDNLICRKMNSEDFYHKMYLSIGSSNLTEDLHRLYCQEFSTLDANSTQGEGHFISSQFIALLTGIPDFYVRAEKLSSGNEIVRSSIDYTWSKWAKNQTEILNRELYFEEPLTLELVDRAQYFDAHKLQLKVSLDVNLGEFDRINQRIGKVKTNFAIRVQKSFLQYYREALKNLDPRNTLEKEHLLKRFKLQMTNDVNMAREKFIIPPWKGDLEGLIGNEISEQLLLMSDKTFKLDNDGTQNINIEINYGLFALKYISHQKSIQDSRAKNKVHSSLNDKQN